MIKEELQRERTEEILPLDVGEHTFNLLPLDGGE
jgi:hypothetical protein